MTTKQMTQQEINESGKIIIGEWGYGSSSAGWIVCDEQDLDAVQAAYDAIGEGDLGPETLDGVRAAGGEYIEEV